MSSSIYYIVNQSIILCHPSLKATSRVLHHFLCRSLLPSNLSDILFRFNIRNLGINISRIQQNLQPCCFKFSKELYSTRIFSKHFTNMIVTRLPNCILDMQLLLDCLVVKEKSNTGIISTATWLIFNEVVHLLIESSVPKFSVGLTVRTRSCLHIANSNAVVWVISFYRLNRWKNTSSASLLPIKQEGFVASDELYLQLVSKFFISGP